MGVYSSYRLATKELFDTPNYSAPSIMETVIQIHETEQKVFESLLELDMMEIYIKEEDESEASKTATENKKKKLSEVIVNAVKKAVEAVRNAVSNFIDKLSMVLNQNKKIKDTYVPYIIKSKHLKNYTLPADMKVKNDNVELKGRDELKSISDKYLRSIKTAKSVEDVAKFKEECMKKIEDIVNKEKNNTQVYTFYPAGSKISSSDISNFGNRLDAAKTKAIRDIKTNGNKTISELKNQKKNFEGAMSDIQKEKSIVEAGTEAAFKIISATIRGYLKLQQFEIEQFRIDFKSARSTILSAYSFCHKAENKENKGNNDAKNESASLLESTVIIESSDSYIDAIFE